MAILAVPLGLMARSGTSLRTVERAGTVVPLHGDSAGTELAGRKDYLARALYLVDDSKGTF